MKYFRYQWLLDDNDPSVSEKRMAKNWRDYKRHLQAYWRELDRLRGRVPEAAWKFFRHGFEETGLADAHLLSLEAGDGIDFRATGREPFFLNRQKATVRIRFLNLRQDRLFTFFYRGVTAFSVEHSPAKGLMSFRPEEFGDLHAYELTAHGQKLLRQDFLFASGSTISTVFAKLQLRKVTIKRRYDISDAYRVRRRPARKPSSRRRT